MSVNYDLILKNGTCITPNGAEKTDIAVKDGRIAAIGDLSRDRAEQTEDCKGLHILPGVIDTQVHFREPGAEHKEDLESGTKSALLGGVTCVFEMPNTNPLTVVPEALENKLARMKDRAWVDYAFYFGGTHENAEHLSDWENLPGVCGIKIFMGSSTGSLLTKDDDDVRAVLANGRRVVAVHAEDENMLEDNKKTILGESHDVSMHPVWRSPEQCVSATKRLIALARETGRRVHVLHITTAEEMEFLARNKDIATVEVLPNHLTLHAPDCYEELGTKAQQNPPIRNKTQQDALWRAIAEGVVDIVGSDHAPHTLEEKAAIYPRSPSGTPGVQTLVPIMLNHVHEGRLTLERFVDLVCHGPNRVHQIAGKGRIARGYDGDFTIVDLKAKHEIRDKDQASRSGWTPYNGMKVTGWPVMTVIRGYIGMKHGEVQGQPQGRKARFRESLPGS